MYMCDNQDGEHEDPGLIITLNTDVQVHNSLGLPSVTAGLTMPHNVPGPAFPLQQGKMQYPYTN